MFKLLDFFCFWGFVRARGGVSLSVYTECNHIAGRRVRLYHKWYLDTTTMQPHVLKHSTCYKLVEQMSSFIFLVLHWVKTLKCCMYVLYVLYYFSQLSTYYKKKYIFPDIILYSSIKDGKIYLYGFSIPLLPYPTAVFAIGNGATKMIQRIKHRLYENGLR